MFSATPSWGFKSIIVGVRAPSFSVMNYTFDPQDFSLSLHKGQQQILPWAVSQKEQQETPATWRVPAFSLCSPGISGTHLHAHELLSDSFPGRWPEAQKINSASASDLDASSPHASLLCEEGMTGVEDKIPQSQSDLKSESQHKQRGRTRPESELAVNSSRCDGNGHRLQALEDPMATAHRYLGMRVQLWAPVKSRSTPVRVNGRCWPHRWTMSPDSQGRAWKAQCDPKSPIWLTASQVQPSPTTYMHSHWVLAFILILSPPLDFSMAPPSHDCFVCIVGHEVLNGECVWLCFVVLTIEFVP